MKTDEPANTATRRRVARTLGLVMFAFMSIVSAVILLTEENFELVDYLLIIGMPLVMGAFAYWVGRYHDPKASE